VIMSGSANDKPDDERSKAARENFPGLPPELFALRALARPISSELNPPRSHVADTARLFLEKTEVKNYTFASEGTKTIFFWSHGSNVATMRFYNYEGSLNPRPEALAKVSTESPLMARESLHFSTDEQGLMHIRL